MNKKQMICIITAMVTIIIVAFILKTKYITVANIPTDSMDPTIKQEEVTIGLRGVSQIERGDIILFRRPGKTKAYIKRVIGLPEETVTIVKGKVYINGELLQETYVKENWDTTGEIQVYHVPQGEFFVLGDNRLNSEDSRNWGNVKEENVYARAVAVCYPVRNMRILCAD